MNIGANIIMATNWSTNIQATKKNILTTVNTFIALGFVPNIDAVNNCGIRPKENIQANEAPAATNINTTAVTTPDDKAIFGISLILIDLYTNNSV